MSGKGRREDEHRRAQQEGGRFRATGRPERESVPPGGAARNAAGAPAEAVANALVEVRGLYKTFVLPRRRLFAPAPRVTAVEDVSFDVARGSTFGLVGESGSGKTTIARMLLKLERPTAGSILFEGRDLHAQNRVEELAYRHRVQAVLQDPYGALSQRMRIGSIVAEPLMAQGVARKEALAAAARLVESVGLPRDTAERYPHQFSGGQRQRIALARALSVDPRLVILDEPVSALDVSVRAQVLALLRDTQERLGLGYVFIGHDLAIVRYMSTTVGVMYFGRLVEIGPANEVFGRPLHPYTQKLVAVAAGWHPLGDVRLSGELPDPLAPPAGCHFRSRCPRAQALCSEAVPALATQAAGHRVACHFPGP